VNLSEAVDRGDLDELVRLVDGLASAREWHRIVDLRDRCRHAMERGLQLWPAAEYAEYRLALDAPGQFAGPVVVEGAGRFALGPLWEVAASSHTWEDLAPHVPPGPARAMAAHERVLRGEDLRGDDTVDPLVLEIPLVLEPWEPEYAVATYRSDEADLPAPDLPPIGAPASMGAPGDLLDRPVETEALLDPVLVWLEQSNGEARAVAVEGDAEAAIAALGVTDGGIAELEPAAAVSWLAWAGASGGGHGRRRGGPAGRFAAWWAVVTLAGLEWPPAEGEVAEASHRLKWVRWSGPGGGNWELRLAVEDPARGLAWAVDAFDSAEPDA
jgi:hypothetical protein